MIRFWDVLERAENGEIMEEKEWDRLIGEVAAQVVSDHDVKYDPENPVPADDSLADRLFEAGVELFEKTGIYCIDTQRVLKFTKEEIMEVFELVSVLGIHTCTVGVPILVEELRNAGIEI